MMDYLANKAVQLVGFATQPVTELDLMRERVGDTIRHLKYMVTSAKKISLKDMLKPFVKLVMNLLKQYSCVVGRGLFLKDKLWDALGQNSEVASKIEEAKAEESKANAEAHKDDDDMSGSLEKMKPQMLQAYRKCSWKERATKMCTAIRPLSTCNDDAADPDNPIADDTYCCCSGLWITCADRMSCGLGAVLEATLNEVMGAVGDMFDKLKDPRNWVADDLGIILYKSSYGLWGKANRYVDRV